MQSVYQEQFGDPAEVVLSGDRPRPVPGAGQVLLRVILSPIHNHDLWTLRGQYGTLPDLPAIGGSEAVGIVEEVGPDVDAALKGRRVSAAGISGAWAEYALARAEGVIPLPDSIPDEAAAQLIAMPFSAITLLEFLNVRRGDWVVQTAANGAVGKMLVPLAEARGVRVLNLVRRAEAADELTEMGIPHVVSTDSEGWQDRARAILGKDGARAAVNSVGGEIVTALAGLLGENGLLVTFGSATGGALQLPTNDLIFKQLTVRGFWGAKVAANMPASEMARLMGEIIGLVAQGKMPLPSGGSFPLHDARQAMIAAQTPGRSGKIMLRP